MATANENMDVAQIRDTLKEFNKEMEKAGMKQEMMGDAMDMMADPSEQADADDVYNGILGEIGMEGMQQMGNNVGTGAIKGPAQQQNVQEEVKANQDDELEARLAALRM